MVLQEHNAAGHVASHPSTLHYFPYNLSGLLRVIPYFTHVSFFTALTRVSHVLRILPWVSSEKKNKHGGVDVCAFTVPCDGRKKRIVHLKKQFDVVQSRRTKPCRISIKAAVDDVDSIQGQIHRNIVFD